MSSPPRPPSSTAAPAPVGGDETPTGPPEAPPSDAASAIAGTLQTLFFLSYPLIVYLAYTRLGTRSLAMLLLGLYFVSILFRLRGSREHVWQLFRQHVGLVVLIGLSVATGNRTLLLLLPVTINLYLLGTFASSLRNGMPMVEKFARIVEDDLPDFTLPYCRKVTIAWCGFLGLNALCLVVLAIAAPVEWWALYTGLISYVLIGLLFVGEFVMRKLWFRHYSDGLADRLFARVFPAHRTANGRRSLAYAAQRGLEPSDLP